MAFEEKTIDSKIVYEGPIFDIRKYEVETVAGIGYRDVLEHNGGSVIMPIKDDGKIVLVKQYRKPLEAEVLELPAGKIDEGEEPLVAAIRELKEETGYTANSMEHLISFTPTCGYSGERLHIYYCKGLTPGETNFDETEDLDIVEYSVNELIEMIKSGIIHDSKTIIGILYARLQGII
ncbi:MAG: NUDIX hydrolase [Clostridiales bacterium]|nr:NUDIX hydrolase [Clostridiales bacterium]